MQDGVELCKLYLVGKCPRSDCSYSHDLETRVDQRLTSGQAPPASGPSASVPVGTSSTPVPHPPAPTNGPLRSLSVSTVPQTIAHLLPPRVSPSHIQELAECSHVQQPPESGTGNSAPVPTDSARVRRYCRACCKSVFNHVDSRRTRTWFNTLATSAGCTSRASVGTRRANIDIATQKRSRALPTRATLPLIHHPRNRSCRVPRQCRLVWN